MICVTVEKMTVVSRKFHVGNTILLDIAINGYGYTKCITHRFWYFSLCYIRYDILLHISRIYENRLEKMLRINLRFRCIEIESIKIQLS